MGTVEPVDVLLPAGYTTAKRWPVLYLLHGGLGSYSDWVTHGVEKVLGTFAAIVVMPDGGPFGSYSDWYGLMPQDRGPVPAWETYHLSELVPFIDRVFPTIPDPAYRFIAGLSSGGGGATKYAAARPGIFGAVGSFSGAVDTDLDYPQYPLISEVLWGISDIPGYGPDAHCTWGDPITQRVVWRDNTAAAMAENLRGTALFLACGDGRPGRYDATSPYWDPVEYEVWRMNLAFVSALDTAKIPHTDDFYGPGHHGWPYWLDDLKAFLAWLGPRVGAPVRAPPVFSYHTARSRFSAWGWTFSVHRDVVENLYVRRMSRGELDVTGSGTLDVVTAPLYAAGHRYEVRAGRMVSVIVPDGKGQLHLRVDLGPSHEIQQYSFVASATKDWKRVRLTISESRS